MTRAIGGVDALTERVIGCAIEVHRTLGPGLVESVYRDCLLVELNDAHLFAESDRCVPVRYKGRTAGSALKLDMLVENCLVVELKSVERLHPIHLAQVITYLKLTGYPVGLLMNFNGTSLRAETPRSP